MLIMNIAVVSYLLNHSYFNINQQLEKVDQSKWIPYNLTQPHSKAMISQIIDIIPIQNETMNDDEVIFTIQTSKSNSKNKYIKYDISSQSFKRKLKLSYQ